MRSDTGVMENMPVVHARGADQAEGLRRMLIENQTQVITMASGKQGVGRTSATLNLATALAAAGKDVLVLDENPAPNNLANSLGLMVRHDLLDVMQGKCQLRDAVLRAKGFVILPAARAMRALGSLNAAEQQCMEHALREVSGGVDVMLVDAAMLSGQSAVSSCLAPGVRLVVVMDATPSGITESYGLIKRLALENARLRFEIVVNKVADEKVARLAFSNMEKVARSKLAARLEYLGCIPLDEQMKRATRLEKSVVEAFPTSAAAHSYRALTQAVLQMAASQDEMEGGISQMMRNLIKQISRCNGKEMTKAVNSARAVANC